MANKTLRKRVMAVALAMTSAGTMIAPMATPMVVMAAESVSDGNAGISTASEDVVQYVEATLGNTTLIGDTNVISVADAGISTTGDVVIPETIEYNSVTYKITSIGENAFSGCTEIKSVIIPGSVKTIEQYAFSGCTGLVTVEIREGLETIGTGAFSGTSPCTALTTVVFPSTLKTVGAAAFQGCKVLTNITLPEGLENIEQNAFGSCQKLYEIEIPSTVKVIGSAAFANCYNMKTIKFNEGLEEIKSSAFSNSYAVTSLEFPSTLKKIGSKAFQLIYNTKLSSITYKGDLESIGTSVFKANQTLNITLNAYSTNTLALNYDYAGDNLNITTNLLDNSDDESNDESGENSNQSDMCVTGYVTPISEMDVKIPLDGFKFHIDENRDLIPTISNLENNSQFPLDVKALNIVGNIGTEPSVIAADTYTQYEWDNMSKAKTLANMALYLNGQELFEIFQNTSLDNSKAIKIGRLDSGFSGTTQLEVTPGAQYGKNFGNREEMLTFVYDLVLEFEVPEV